MRSGAGSVPPANRRPAPTRRFGRRGRWTRPLYCLPRSSRWSAPSRDTISRPPERGAEAGILVDSIPRAKGILTWRRPTPSRTGCSAAMCAHAVSAPLQQPGGRRTSGQTCRLSKRAGGPTSRGSLVRARYRPPSTIQAIRRRRRLRLDGQERGCTRRLPWCALRCCCVRSLLSVTPARPTIRP